MTGTKRLGALFQAPGVERNPSLTPDGRFLAYDSDESGRTEVYVRPFPNVGSRKWQVSTDGGSAPVWTKDGREIVYVDGQNRMTTVTARSAGGHELELTKPAPLFQARATALVVPERSWDVTADGERFLMRTSDLDVKEAAIPVELILIQNWSEELKRLVPQLPR